MQWMALIIIAFSLSLDAFAVAITCGIKVYHLSLPIFLKIALSFGLFQGLMPVGGWFLGKLMSDFLTPFSHWITAAIFFVLGTKMLFDLRNKDDATEEGKGRGESHCCQCKNLICLSSLSIATSIDAFMIGLTLYLENFILIPSCIVIGVITFGMTLLGCFIGNRSILFLQRRARFVAAILLLILAVKAVILAVLV